MALKWSNNKQRLPWTTLKPLAFAGGFQNSPAGFETVQTASKPSDGFKAVRVSNWFKAYIGNSFYVSLYTNVSRVLVFENQQLKTFMSNAVYQW